MKKKTPSRPNRATRSSDRDTMRPEYDFSEAMRGLTLMHVARGTNVVAIDPDLLDVFPDSKAVNETLRALAPIFRGLRRKRPTR